MQIRVFEGLFLQWTNYFSTSHHQLTITVSCMKKKKSQDFIDFFRNVY